MTNRTWHKGPPPHVGRWNASAGRDPEAWRWWDGRYWSFVAYPGMSANSADINAKERLYDACDIEWSDYWPENARVPRVKPDAS